MAQVLQVTAAPLLPVLDLDRPTFLGSMPSWLASRIDAESRSEHRRIVRDATGRQIGEVRTLPKSLTLSGAMRAVLSRRVDELEAALVAGPPEDTLDHVMLLLRRYLAGKSDDELALRAETYLEALDDVPAWTVREAIRRWFKGQCGGEVRDYDFTPSEARLFRVAEGIVKATRGQILVFRRLLLAEPEPEIPEAVRARQAAELRVLVAELAVRVPDRAEAARRGVPAGPGTAEPPPDRAALSADLARRRARREAEEAERRAATAAAAGPDAGEAGGRSPAAVET